MSNELIINSTGKGERIALLQDKRLVEYHTEESEHNISVGDIYLGVIRKLSPGLNAAFVDVGYEKDGFLHYADLSPNFNSLSKYTRDVIAGRQQTHRLNEFSLEPEIDKLGKIGPVLGRPGSTVLVQVVKEPISTKGPRLSCEISIAGRYMVLVPFTNAVNISKKITSKEERTRLQRLVASIKPANFGVIVRTVAEGKEVAELDRDLRNLVEKWETAFKNLKSAQPRALILSEMNRSSSILRDMLNESFDSITVDEESSFEEIRSYIRSIAPDKEKILRLHKSKVKLFEQYGIEKQLKSIFGRTVSLPGGGYVIIEHTEALHVIDVNSGNKSNSEADQEATALSVNMEAAKEIARQLRVRDMGGIIVVDFIDMKKPDNKRVIYEKMKDEMGTDRSKFTILPLSKFGLLQITRQRVRPEVNIATGEVCPVCNGTGKITASILISDTIEQQLEHLLSHQNEKSVSVVVHPYLHSYFRNGFPSAQMKWIFKYRRWVKLIKDSSLGMTEYHFLNGAGELIEMTAH